MFVLYYLSIVIKVKQFTARIVSVSCSYVLCYMENRFCSCQSQFDFVSYFPTSCRPWELENRSDPFPCQML